MRVAGIALQDARLKVRLNIRERGFEHREVRDLPGHQEAQRVVDKRIVRELQQILIDDLGARLGSHVGPKINSEIAIGVDV